MERENSSSYSVNAPQESSNYDELFMQRSLVFADSLKDLKNLRKQLYSAAEYFELSYHKDDHEQLVVETLKDYITKALINTVDHLGSVAYKVNNFLEEKVNEVSATKLRVSCIEQRLQTCQEFIDRGGILQQSLVIQTPKYHKQYIIPAKHTAHAVGKIGSIYINHSLIPENELHPPFKATTVKPQLSLLRKGHSKPPSTESSGSPQAFLFTRVASNKGLEKRAVSPLRFPLKRFGSVANRSNSPSSASRQRCPSEPRRSVSLCIHPARERTEDIEQRAKKSNSLLRALLSIHKSKKDGRLRRYQDDN